MEELGRVLHGKVVVVTGGTGFVGKAVIEKILRGGYDGFGEGGYGRGWPRKLVVLIRPGNGMVVAERLEKEIIESPIFEPFKERLREDGVKFEEVWKDRIVGVHADLTLPKLGIAQEDLDMMLTERVDIILHCAASVNFDDPLDLALALNTQGAVRTLELAHILKVDAFVHVSTAYVNANIKTGEVLKEKIYPMEFDPADVLAKHVNTTNSTGGIGVNRLHLKIQGEYPNTYTLTKAMSEVLLERNHGDLPLAIVRPSIVGASWKEPCPGWVDAISAASAVFMASCLGVVTMLPGNPRGVAAIVPVDFVVNHILVALADVYQKKGKLTISHCCSSTLNPCRWRVVSREVLGAYQKRRPPVKLTPGPVKFRMLPNRQQFNFEWALRYNLPTWAYGQFAKLSGIKSYTRTAGQLEMLLNRSEYIINLFEPFTMTEYLFDCETMKKWAARPGGNEVLDIMDVSWPRYFENYVYGLNRFILQEDLVPISESSVSHNHVSLTVGRLLEWDADHHRISFPGLISDISWAYTSSRQPGYTKSGGVLGRLMGLTGWREGLAHEAKHVPRKTKRTVDEMRDLVFRSAIVKREINNDPKLKAKAKEYFEEIASTMVDGPPRAFGWLLRKVWRNLYDGIRVHEEGLEKFRKVVADGRYPVVLVPTHRSYVDFLMLSYLCFAFNLPCPFIVASTDFLGMKGVSSILRNSGAFFLRRQGVFAKDSLYAAVFTGYMQQLLVDKQIVEYYIEGTRSRSGKTLEPKQGITRICMEPVLDGRVTDVIMIPISIDYEKPIEAIVYSQEMLGGSKTPETTGNLLKRSLDFIKGQQQKQKFGYVSVQFGDHISVRQTLLNKKSLTMEIIRGMHAAAVCMPIHLVSTLLLMYRHGITLDQLVSSVEWLRLEVLSRGGHVACTEGEHRTDLVKRAIHLLGPVVKERASPRVFEVAVKKDYLNLIILGYYRNKIIHLFAQESLWACALYAHNSNHHFPSVQADMSFLNALLCREFVGCRYSKKVALENLLQREILQKRDDNLQVFPNIQAERVFGLLCSIAWPLVDSYFVAASAFIALVPDAMVRSSTLIQRMSILAETMYHDRILYHYESCSSGTLKNAIETLLEWEVIKRIEKPPSKKLIGGKRNQPPESFIVLNPPYNDRSQLQLLIERIDSLRGPTTLKTTTKVADFPMLARI